MRFARSHGPFTAGALAARYGLGVGRGRAAAAAADRGRAPHRRRVPARRHRARVGGRQRPAQPAQPLAARSCVTRSRPVDADALGRFMVAWHGIGSQRRGLEALLDAIEQLQGAAMPASVLERDILPARVDDYVPAMLDTLMAAGEVVWVGVERLGERDGRIALYLTDHVHAPAAAASTAPPALDGRVREPCATTSRRTARRSSPPFARAPATASPPTPSMRCGSWCGWGWSPTTRCTRCAATCGASETPPRRGGRRRRRFRSRRSSPRGLGRPVVARRDRGGDDGRRHRVGRRDGAAAPHALRRRDARDRRRPKRSPAASRAVYQVLRAMEDAGRIRRGYFVAGLGGAQFAMPAALDLLRSHREPPETPHAVVLAATDPANPYGTLLKWPEAAGTAAGRGPRPTSAAAPRAPWARWSSWSTVSPPATCGAASATCCWRCPTRSRRAAASRRRWRARSSGLALAASGGPARAVSRDDQRHARRRAPGGALVRGRGLRRWAPRACSSERRESRTTASSEAQRFRCACRRT